VSVSCCFFSRDLFKKNMTILIKNGLLYDGAGSVPTQKNILIKNGHIAKIDSVFSHNAHKVIDATGSIILPGFIDVGSYADKSFSLFWDPSQQNAVEQGITTQIIGNDGVSIMPFSRASLEFVVPHTARSAIAHNWHSVKHFLAALHGKVATNVGTLVGMRTVKTLVTKDESRELNNKELETLEHITKKSLLEGALGISIGYSRTTRENAPYYEIKDFIPIVENMKRVCVIHPPANNFSAACEEIIQYTSKTSANIEISHTQTFLDSSSTNKKTFNFIETLSKTNYVHFDVFPFQTTPIHAYELLPDWLFGENDVSITQKLIAPENKAKIMRRFASFEKLKLSVDAVADPMFQFFEGKTVSSIAENAGMSYGEAFLYLLKITKFRIYFLASSPKEKTIDAIFTHPQALFNWGRIGKPDGKTPFAFLRMIAEKGTIDLEKIIEKMTSLPAKKYGIAKRGILAQGNYADILIVNNFELTHAFINGIEIFEHGKIERRVFPGMAIMP